MGSLDEGELLPSRLGCAAAAPISSDRARSRAGSLVMREGQDDLVRAGTVEELQAKGRTVVRGRRCPILVVHDQGRVSAMDNRCPHLGFPLHRGSIADGILTCH